MDVVESGAAAVNFVFGTEMDAVCEAAFPAASCAARKPITLLESGDKSSVVSTLMCPSEGYDYDPEPVVVEVCTPCHALSEALPAESEALMEAFLVALKTATSIADVVPTLSAVKADESATAYLQCMSCTLCSKRYCYCYSLINHPTETRCRVVCLLCCSADDVSGCT